MIAGADTYRFNLDEYHRLGETGILGNRDRIELLGGELVIMSPVGKRHAKSIRRLIKAFAERLRGRCTIDCQNPLVIGSYSEPQPDILLLKPGFEDSDELPKPDDVLLVIEVADSSLGYDRGAKLKAYAVGHVREVWILNLVENVIERYQQPDSGAYQSVSLRRRGDSISAEAFAETQFLVDDLLP